MKRRPARPGVPEAGDALASASPMSAEEVEFLAEVAGRYSVPLVALGAGTASMLGSEGGGILIHLDLMRGLRLAEHGEPWVEAEPGVSWLQLDDHLRIWGCGLAVYPTSARRATVGGWLTQDGLGVGSFEYGWVSENVLSANLVLPGGERWEVPGKAQIRRHREGESPFEVAVDGYTEAGGFGLPKLTKKPEQPGSWKACMACGARWIR